MAHVPHLLVRRAALYCLACIGLIAIIAIIMALVHGGIPMGRALLAIIILAVLGGAPLGVVVHRLTRGSDAVGLAVAIVYPTLVFVVLFLEARAMWLSGTDGQMDLFARIVFFFADPAWAVFVAGVLPCLVMMAKRAVRALRAGTSGSLGAAFAGATLVLVAGYALIWRPVTGYPSMEPKGFEHLNIRSLLSSGPPGSRRTVRQAGEALELTRDVYDCLLPPEGPTQDPLRFPATIGGMASSDTFTGNDNCSQLVQRLEHQPGTYTVTYVPGPLEPDGTARSFVLRVRERSVGRWGLQSEEWEVSESAASRRTVFDWRGRAIEAESGPQFVDGLFMVLYLERMMATPFGGDSTHALPERLRGELPADTVPGDRAVGSPFMTCRTALDASLAAKGASCLATTYRRWIYEPVRDTSGRVTAWAMHAPAPKNRGTTPSDFGAYRSYYRHTTGTFHARGPWSPAGPGDPLVPADEVTAARRSLERWWTVNLSSWRYGLR